MKEDTHLARQPRFYDAHNHLQDERLAPFLEAALVETQKENVVRMVVNGSCAEDWPAVLALAQRCRQVIPSFGYHPWYIRQRPPDWQDTLVRFLDEIPSAVGEIGLDAWEKDHDLAQQEEVFVWQLRLAAGRNLPASIHCLQAWGRLLEVLRTEPRPVCGFVLHSFGGPREMIQPLTDLGAYFSLPGYFAQARKERQRETFRHVPLDRLLIETDAPDQSLPAERVRYPLPADSSGKPVNHPANLAAVYAFAANLLEQPMEVLADQIEKNFHRLFGPLRGDGGHGTTRPNGADSRIIS